MKNAKLLVLALLVVLLACLAVSAYAMPDLNGCPVNGQHVWEVTKTDNPTCLQAGKLTYQCKMCLQYGYEDFGAPLGHQPGDLVIVTPADGCKTGAVWQQKCKFCDYHFYGTTVTEPRSEAHTWESAVGTAYKTAADMLSNGSIEKFPGKDATCTADGIKSKIVCGKCGAVAPGFDGSVIKAKGHVLGTTWIQKKAATCAAGGEIVLYCANNCGTVMQTKSTPKATFHTDKDGNYNPDPWVVVVPAKPATCTEPGCKELDKCGICGAVRPGFDGSKINALGHKMEVVADMCTMPTCTKAGQNCLQCTRVIDWGGNMVPCGHIMYNTIPATGHTAYWHVDAAGSVPGGYTLYVLECSACHTILASQVVQPGEKAPTGKVTTGALKDNKEVTGTTSGAKKVARTTTTKKTTTAKKTTTKAATTTTTTVAAATEVKAEGTKLVAGINNLEDKAVVVVKDGKATLVYAEADVIVKIGETALEANVPVDVAADATATVAAADAAATK